jgi:hypothetical protein
VLRTVTPTRTRSTKRRVYHEEEYHDGGPSNRWGHGTDAGDIRIRYIEKKWFGGARRVGGERCEDGPFGSTLNTNDM